MSMLKTLVTTVAIKGMDSSKLDNMEAHRKRISLLAPDSANRALNPEKDSLNAQKRKDAHGIRARLYVVLEPS
jgi:hypothetical protein